MRSAITPSLDVMASASCTGELRRLGRFALARLWRCADKRREVQVVEHALENGIEEETLHKRHGHLSRDREVGLPPEGWLHRPGGDGRVITCVAPDQLQQRLGRIGIGKTHVLPDQCRALRLYFYFVPMSANDRGRDDLRIGGRIGMVVRQDRKELLRCDRNEFGVLKMY